MKLNKIIYFIVFAFPLYSFISQENNLHTFQNKTFRCEYSTLKGRIHGPYRSYYLNGQKKAEGNFCDNFRCGMWSVWDSTGKLRMQRNYSGPFSYQRMYPKTPEDATIQLLQTSPYSIHYQKEGYVEYFPVEERMIIWNTRIWREIKAENNSLIFQHPLFQSLLLAHEHWFCAKDERFQEAYETPLDTSQYAVVALKIMEDVFFDNERLLSESRIIGICPVFENKKDHQQQEGYWAYYPNLRKYFAKLSIQAPELSAQIKSMEDVFFYRNFAATVYKISNVQNLPLSDYSDKNENSSEAIELKLIEMEHDLWISLTAKE